jgi:RNA polymerase sigma-70 factor (ECF subfamily)
VTQIRSQSPAAASGPDEAVLLDRLRAGDEQAFEELVDGHYPTMLAVARGYVKSRAVAEEVVQEAWVGVLKGLDRFEGRSSLRTWIIRIVVNIAQTRGAREARSVPLSSLAPDGQEPAVEPERFRGRQDSFAGHWRRYPLNWEALPEQALFGRETLDVVMAAVTALPPAQRQVIALRDISGWSAEDVCDALDITAGNQRVLLHRARSRVRATLEDHFDG